jgi:uncharacterized protein YxeA
MIIIIILIIFGGLYFIRKINYTKMENFVPKKATTHSSNPEIPFLKSASTGGNWSKPYNIKNL